MTQENDLRKQGRQLTLTLSELTHSVRSFGSSAARAVRDLETELEAVRYPGLHLPTLLRPLCGDIDALDVEWIPGGVALIGEGPWSKGDLSGFLEECGFVQLPEPVPGATVVLGACSWSDEEVASLARRMQTMTVYTQELLILGLARSADPFELMDNLQIEDIANTHRGITRLLELEAHCWPSGPGWLIPSSGGDMEADEPQSFRNKLDHAERLDYDAIKNHNWQTGSILSDLGYSANANGPDESERRDALDRAICEDLQGIARGDDLERWGAPRSTARLAALVSFMMWLNRVQSADKPVAQAIRISDLRWLERRYDPKGTKFDWPVLDEPITPAKKRTPNAEFMKALQPDAVLAAVVGSQPLPHTEIVSKLWAYIKKNKLQDPVNKRMVKGDAKLIALFGREQVSMFEMAGLIGKHVKRATSPS
jgi:hypothetical protein